LVVSAPRPVPKNFDPIFNDEGESFRPQHQIFETLIAYKPGSADSGGPGLAHLVDADGRGQDLDVWPCGRGLKFQDGTPFDAAAVVLSNFDRWFNMKGAAAQSQMIYYGDRLRGLSRTTRATTTGQARSTRTARLPTRNTAVRAPEPVQGGVPGRVRSDVAVPLEPGRVEAVQTADQVTQSG